MTKSEQKKIATALSAIIDALLYAEKYVKTDDDVCNRQTLIDGQIQGIARAIDLINNWPAVDINKYK